jgi:hypothetical protein
MYTVVILDLGRCSACFSLLSIVGTETMSSSSGSRIFHRISYSLSEIQTLSLVFRNSQRSSLDTIYMLQFPDLELSAFSKAMR